MRRDVRGYSKTNMNRPYDAPPRVTRHPQPLGDSPANVHSHSVDGPHDVCVRSRHWEDAGLQAS